ncbi:MAG TPA: P-loop NTPase [Spirochaetia bacterium]|nr:P-loop NTPase [Spirochaetales bacterium]HRY81775.1 P-loop NTPase [Spirochaetia bacterium]
MHIVPIASGKGGVGKSLVAANLSIALAEAGRRVILADLDLGASNLHVILGIPSTGRGVGTWLSTSGAEFSDIVLSSDYPNLRFIPGDAEIPGLANITAPQKHRLIRKLLALDADYLVLDLGAGTGANILDFFLTATQGIVVTAPALTATLNAYLFLKNAIFRLMWTTFKKGSAAYAVLEGLRKDGSSLQKAYVPAILDQVGRADPESRAAFEAKAAQFRPRLVMNMLEDPKDAEKAQKIRKSSLQYLNLDVEHLGILYRDDLQDIALGSRIPILRYKPQAVLSQAIYRMADKLLSCEDAAEEPLSDAYLDETYQTAEMEAEIDYSAKVEYIEDLLHSGSLTPGDLVETVKSQQFEIGQLRKENQFLKSKLVKAFSQGFKG